MRNLFSKYKVVTLVFSVIFSGVFSLIEAQVSANKEVGKRNQAYADSLKNSEYPYILPIWGDKVTKMGISLPYSAGVSVQYLWQESDIIIDNLMVGFNNNEKYNLDQIVRFNETKSTANAMNFRPDVWVLPFLNVYGIIATSQLSTIVDYSIFVPDSLGNSKEAIRLNSKANFNATSFGFGVTPTFAVAGLFVALDMNFTWNDIPELKKPAFAFVLGPRLGKTFKFKKPERNIALWVGGFRLKLNSGTEGSLLMKDVLDLSDLQPKIDAASIKVDEAYVQVDTWWNNLSPAEQKKPGNIAKYERANSAITKADGYVGSLDEALNDSQQASVQYSLDKRPANMWNFIVGTQFQINKHWMIRAEYGFLGTRNQFITGLQYRFGL